MDEDQVPLRPETPAPFSIGQEVDDYRFLSILGKGSFATVYLAEEKSLGRKVAIKVGDSRMLEGKTIAQLQHESILRVHSQGTLRGFAIINMQYVLSVTFEDLVAEVMRTGEPSEKESAWIRALAARFPGGVSSQDAEHRAREYLAAHAGVEGLAFLRRSALGSFGDAHANGVLHLDIKPSNILIHASGKPYLMDFNTATRREDLDAGVPENFGGTFAFMAPEQLLVFFANDRSMAVRAVGEHSDVFSLGKVLLVALKALPGEPGDARERLQAILTRATQTEIAQRYHSAAELGAALRGFLVVSDARHRLPKSGRFLLLAERYPLTAITLWGGLPQMIAAFVGYLYNQSQIISHLSPLQQEMFLRLNLYYNPALYVAGMALWLYLLRGLHRSLQKPVRDTATCRRLALRIPFWGAIVSSLGWLPGAILFPTVLARLPGGLAPATLVHFAISFLLSYLIAFAYSYLTQAYLMAGVLYPRLWSTESNVAGTAREELGPLNRRILQLSALTMVIPILSLSFLLYRSEDFTDRAQYDSFRLLIALLSSPGTAGVWFSMAVKERVKSLTRLF